MTCPRCGHQMPAASSRCSRCAVPLEPAVATGVLTPPPSDNAQTQFVDPRAKTARGNQAVPPDVLTPVPDDADQTRFIDPLTPTAVALPHTGDASTQFVDPRSPTALGQRDAGEDSPTAFVGASTIGRAARATSSPVNGPLQPGQAFGSRYQIIRTLGVGGMGAVYEAYDAELGVTVALKVIRPDVMEDPIAAAEIERRFKRELLLARQVTHKNVVRIHDLGDLDGLKFITMSYVDGADLATILKRDGKLPVSRVLRIARSVASGLVEAHKQGVVHRDLKPANIMITAEDDEAMIMDFGIARSTGGSTARTGQTAVGAVPGPGTIVRNLGRGTLSPSSETVFGAVLGTVEYMAPEQAQGRPVDQRADVYAFGLILYDLLTGEPRSAKALSPILELQGRMQKAPPPIQTLEPEVPEPFAEIIARCLEPDPDKRFQTSEDVSAALALLDDNGVPIPIPPRFGKRVIAAAAVAVIALVTGTWWFTRTPPPPKQHDPVAVVIADFQNETGDPTFDHTLEQTLRRGLEGAGFITAYDKTRIRPALGLPAPDTLDEVSAREIAVKAGLGVVLSGSIRSRGTGYEISVKASQTATGEAIATEQGRASSKAEVLTAAASLAANVRQALGDQTSGSAQLLGMKGLSTGSLEAVSHYASAVDAQAKGNYEAARASFQKATAIDPQFGLAYQGLAAASRSLGQLEDSGKYASEALRYLDGMTERERFATRGNYYRMTGDFPQCVKEYGELIARYAADTVALNNLGVCRAKMRDMPGAVDALRKAVQILPNRVTYRANLALFAVYAGDFAAAEQEVQALPNPDSHGIAALALSQVGQGRLAEAADTYKKLATMDAWGASFSASGLGDLALYEGRLSDAVRILEEGAAADLSRKNTDGAAVKYAALAYAHVVRRQMREAVAAADKALGHSKAVSIRFLAARIFVEADALPKARALAGELSAELAAEPQAYGKIVEGEIALKKGDARGAIKILTEANGVIDTWLGHFDLGRAYLAVNAFPQADSEFDRCIERRGEALSLLDEDPTYGYVPPAYYFLGRAREGLKSAGFAESYREYLKIRGQSSEDPLLPEVRKRAGSS